MTGSDTYKLFVLRHGQSELNHENIFCGWIDAGLTEKGKAQAKNAAALIKVHCMANSLEPPKIGYTSRLVRTQQTIEVMLEELNIKPNYRVVTKSTNVDKILREEWSREEALVLQTWRLNERHYGAWQGQRKPTILQEYGKEQYMFIRRDYNGRPPAADLSREMVQEVDDKGSLTGYDFKEPNRRVKYNLEEHSGETLPNNESLSDVVERLDGFLNQIILKNLDYCSSGLVVAHGSSVRSILKIIEGISDTDIKDVEIPNAIPLVIELDRHTKMFVRKYYLDPELAKINAEKVRNEGFEKRD
ncbi:phosphoglycerate mutase family protein GPM3 [Lachancea thermotolerans CBS 6340]|uniref:Phosphoglycerate mutase n=1 Tax=Lachancea thermotolerans (strain ATCC 56472 / CBS 6340 / NRRL Y-8284) TaxID=559295 RepID=C5DKQ7_LACTC|nr:KLTH0F06688p [Lachancea thermotolerans CBS 6340]CAR24058.1 KLTH0F06688p [Lachancea thermotolerans CBS 6340]